MKRLPRSPPIPSPARWIAIAAVAALAAGTFLGLVPGAGGPVTLLHPSLLREDARGGSALGHPLNGGYNVSFSAPDLVGVGGVTFSFRVDGALYSAAGAGTVNVTGLSVGPHAITAISASPATAGWAYFGSASTGGVFSEPGTTAIALTYAYVNRTLPNVTVEFQAPALVPGTPWGLVFNGTFRSSTFTQISLTFPPGNYERSYEQALGLQGNVEYRTNVAPDYSAYPSSEIVTVNYTSYFELGVYGGPGGSVLPNGSTWVLHNGTVRIGAVGSSTDVFKSWTGVGVGNYTGESPQVNVTLSGPVTEFAVFGPRPNNTGVVRFQEHGLPNGTIWTVILAGIGYSSGTSLLVISGLVPCVNLTAGQPGVYAAIFPYDYENLTTPGLSERYLAVAPPPLVCGASERINLNFTTQYLVLDHWSAGGSVTAAVNGSLIGEGYLAPGTVVTFQATPTFGYSFAGWTGVGVGAYSGGLTQVSVTLAGSIDELGSFAAGPLALALGFPITFQVSPSEVVGTAWSVAVDGQAYSANGSQLVVPDIEAGTHSVAVATLWGAGGGSRSVPSAPSFTVSVSGPTEVNLTYVVSYWLSVVVVGAGTVSPGSGWVTAGRPIQLQAAPGGGAVFLGWASAQPDGFTGNNTSAITLTPVGPLVESASFGPAPPPPDFWHRTTTLAAAAAAGLVAGVLLVSLEWRFRRRPPAAPAPPPGAVREWRGVILRRTPSRSGGTPDPRSRTVTVALVLLCFGGALMILAPPGSNLALRPATAAPSFAALPMTPAVASTVAAHPAPPTTGPAPTTHPVPPPHRIGLPATAGPNLTFREAGLPSLVTWSVSVWPFDTSESAPSTWSTNASSVTVPTASSAPSVDFAVWSVPLNATTVWWATTNVTGPVSANTTSVIGVSFAPTAISGLPFRFHLVETGLPSGLLWHTSIVGVGYDVVTPATDWTIAGGKSFVFTAPSDVLSPGEEFDPLRFDVEAMTVGATWSNSTTNPVVRLATADFWIDVNFSAVYRVHVVGDLGGVVTPPSGWFAAGAPITITASALDGYRFVDWSGIGVGALNSTDPSIQVTPGSAVVEIAAFTVAPFEITVTESGVPAGDAYSVVYNGTIYTVNRSSFQLPGLVVGDATLSVPYSPSVLQNGERFVPQNVTSSYAPGPNGTFYVNGNGTFCIAFTVQYALTITSSGAGTTDPSPGSYWETGGAGIAVRALPGNATLALETWRGTGSGSYSGPAAGIVVIMDGPIDEAAQFGLPLPPQGSLLTVGESGLPPGTAWSAAAGSIGGAGATGALVLGPLPLGPTTVVVPDVLLGAGERFVAAAGGAYRFALTGNQSFSVQFTAQWLVNVTVLFGGSVADYPSWVPANASVSLLADPPSPGYQFNGWSGATNSSGALITLRASGPLQLTANYGPVPPSGSSGPKDAPIAAADVGIPAVVGAIATFLWYRWRRGA